VELLQGLGIEIYASLIVRPDFTRGDFSALAACCRELELSYAGFAVLTPLPGRGAYALLIPASTPRMWAKDSFMPGRGSLASISYSRLT
jgi:hypothetical protein